MNRSVILAISLRIVYAALIIYAAIQSQWNVVLFNTAILIGSSFVLWLGKIRNDYAILDALITTTFAATLIITLFMTWQTPGTLAFDKIFHALGGMCLAWFAAILYRDQIKSNWFYALAIITFALALGAAWEVFEWLLSLLPAPYATPFNPAGLADSFGDLIADTIGAVIVVVAILSRRRE